VPDKTIQAKAKIYLFRRTKTVTAKARMKPTVKKTVTAKAYIDASLWWYSQQPFRHPKAKITVDWNLGDGFQDETEYLEMVEVERKLTEPLGGVSIAQADVRFINIDDRYTPVAEEIE